MCNVIRILTPQVHPLSLKILLGITFFKIISSSQISSATNLQCKHYVESILEEPLSHDKHRITVKGVTCTVEFTRNCVICWLQRSFRNIYGKTLPEEGLKLKHNRIRNSMIKILNRKCHRPKWQVVASESMAVKRKRYKN